MIAAELLNIIPQLRNPSTKLSNKDLDSSSHPEDSAISFDKLLRYDISFDQMHKTREDVDIIENLEMENEEENRAVSLPLQMGIANTVVAHTVFSKQIQKLDTLLKTAPSRMTRDADCTSFLDMRCMGAKSEITMLGYNGRLFTSVEEEHPLQQQQDVSESLNEKDVIKGHPVMRTLSFDMAFSKIGMRECLEIGDRVQLKSDFSSVSQQSRIEGLEIVQNRKFGDLRILHIKLMPENLGSVQARMRMTANGLHIELQAERTEVARFLASDHQMLLKALKESGCQDHNRISIVVIDRAAHNMVHASSVVSQIGDQAFGGHRPGEQETMPDFQAFGEGGRRFSNDSKKDFPFEKHKPDDLTCDANAYHNSHYLVI
ncbi:MAG: Flagellar hook-length control protein [Candidatus Tokpelaia sp. JSC189]|nr:MAG: Flagellar hook-length control protein [Candidatus Tokpelaia sp. JSC189]